MQPNAMAYIAGARLAGAGGQGSRQSGAPQSGAVAVAADDWDTDEERDALTSSFCGKTTKKGAPCRARKVAGKDACIGHLRQE